MKGSQGYRRRTRNLRVKPKDKGKVSIRKYMQEFKKDDVVSIKVNPLYQAIPHPRFNGKTGKIVSVQGRAYYVSIADGGKKKNILVTPEHLVLQKVK